MARAPIPGLCALVLFGAAGPLPAQTAAPDLREEAARALRRAATFYRDEVARHGGYVYYTSEDLRRRWGEGQAGPDTVFVQPPGTPTVGLAYLRAFDATKDRFYLDAAREAAEALVYGQLQSGGWTQAIHFAPTPGERMGKYRHGRGGSWNASSLDDGQTQAALEFLARADRALDFQHPGIHEAARYGLDALLHAQFPIGAFPQVWTGPVAPHPTLKARYPDYDWKTEGRVKDYWNDYTLNDGLAGTVSDTLLAAHEVYRDDRYRAALAKLGDFLILAQMPDPQPAWCQQYNHEMVPIWARKFEPPAVSGWESQDVLETLITIARHTGEPKYLEPIPRALAYLKASRLPDGRLARYYEFRTNRPLYMDKSYQITYDGSDAPSHYGWTQPSHLEAIERAYQDALAGRDPAPPPPPGEDEVRAILRALDDRGRWISTDHGEPLVGQPKFPEGFRYLSSEVFSRNVETLSDYLASSAR